MLQFWVLAVQNQGIGEVGSFWKVLWEGLLSASSDCSQSWYCLTCSCNIQLLLFFSYDILLYVSVYLISISSSYKDICHVRFGVQHDLVSLFLSLITTLQTLFSNKSHSQVPRLGGEHASLEGQHQSTTDTMVINMVYVWPRYRVDGNSQQSILLNKMTGQGGYLKHNQL